MDPKVLTRCHLVIPFRGLPSVYLTGRRLIGPEAPFWKRQKFVFVVFFLSGASVVYSAAMPKGRINIRILQSEFQNQQNVAYNA